MEYASLELVLKSAASRTSSISMFHFSIKTLLGFHIYLLKSYNSCVVPFLPEKSYTVKEGGGGCS